MRSLNLTALMPNHHLALPFWEGNTAFDLELYKHCRKARVVYDLFHVQFAAKLQPCWRGIAARLR